MRSVFVTSSGDPYVLTHFLSHLRYWRDTVDEIWIAINTTMERSLLPEIIKVIPSDVHFILVDRQIGYGTPFEILLKLSGIGNVLLLEDDTIIFDGEKINEYFKLLEKDQFDLIGSPRMSCPEIVARNLKEEFNLDYSGWGDKGPNFWPCFLFVKKEFLLKTDCNFNPSGYGDTFVWMSIQLRRLGVRIKEIPQYHCSPDDFKNKENNQGIFDGECTYMHLGSLSSGIISYILDEYNVPMADRQTDQPALHPHPVPDTADMQIRIMWWRKCFEESPVRFSIDCDYEFGLKRLYKMISYEKLDEWRKLYENICPNKLARFF